MADKEKLYETLGELLYAVAKADGIIQAEEKTALEKMLRNHPWASQIKWSFNYQSQHSLSIEETYEKVIRLLSSIWPGSRVQ